MIFIFPWQEDRLLSPYWKNLIKHGYIRIFIEPFFTEIRLVSSILNTRKRILHMPNSICENIYFILHQHIPREPYLFSERVFFKLWLPGLYTNLRKFVITVAMVTPKEQEDNVE